MNVLTLPFPCLHLFQLDNLDLGVWWPSLPFFLLKELTTKQVAGRCPLLTKLGHGTDMGAHKGALTGGGGQLSGSKTQHIGNVRFQQRTESMPEGNAIKRGQKKKKNLLLLDPEQVPKDIDKHSCLIWQDPNPAW